MAIGAHPDDIEFVMAGTLLLLKEAGFAIHYMNLSSGNCGNMTMSPAMTRRVRRKESMDAAKLLGAEYHPSIAHDLEIIYDIKTLRRLAAVIREVAPEILLVPSPQDYMEDHTNTCRLAVTAAFARGMPNFQTTPRRKHIAQEVTIYHAMPHGLCDALRQPIIPELFVGTSAVHSLKRKALAAHHSQKSWLDTSQGLDSYLVTMDEMSMELGTGSRRFSYAEGWRRHSHLGFSARDFDPLLEVLGEKALLNPSYGAASVRERYNGSVP